MAEINSYSHNLTFDKPYRLATDNVSARNPSPEYNPVIPPVLGYFLLTDNTNFLLTDGTELLLA